MLPLLQDLAGAVLSPPRCAACDACVRLGVVFCVPCARTIEPAPPGSGWVLAAGAHGGALARAIHRLKYDDRPDLARPLADLIAVAAAPLAKERVHALVPVPLAEGRLVGRGYNQSALLAGRLGAVWNIPMNTRHVRRVRETSPQVAASRREREGNVAGAFVADPAVRGRSVVLVDDVATTLATLYAVSDAICAAGGIVVGAAVVALTAAAEIAENEGVSPGLY